VGSVFKSVQMRVKLTKANCQEILDSHGEGVWEKVQEHSGSQMRYLMGCVAPVCLECLTEWGNMLPNKEAALDVYMTGLGWDIDLKLASEKEVHRLIVALTGDLLTHGWLVADPDKYWKNGKAN